MEDPIYIKVVKPGEFDYKEPCYEKKIEDSTYSERLAWYTRLSRGQIVSLLEVFIKNKQLEGESKI